jgi:hypothetical protein
MSKVAVMILGHVFLELKCLQYVKACQTLYTRKEYLSKYPSWVLTITALPQIAPECYELTVEAYDMHVIAAIYFKGLLLNGIDCVAGSGEGYHITYA